MKAPTIYRAADGTPAFAELRQRATITVVDTLEEQLDDWVAARFPHLKKDAAARLAKRREFVPDSALADYGVYVHFEWSNTLVRLLPEAEFRALRTDRNRQKITACEQAVLETKKVAIAGLSVGLAVATTLAQEGVGSHFVLADFDTLSLSNCNRLRAPLAWLGLPKTVIAARSIWEIDPFAKVTLFSEGVTNENIHAFLDGVDLLVEECDSLGLKLRLREAAKARGIPVVMETSDGGMLDVERFDLEPSRPILHGRTGGVDSHALDALTAKEKVPLFLQIVPPERMTPRMAASLIDIDTTLSSWPQLASAVALGGAVVTDTARRIFLDTFRASGRYYIDLSALVAAERDVSQAPSPPLPGGAPPEAPLRDVVEPGKVPLSAPAPAPTTSATIDELRFLARCAHRAPSAGNAQPWAFEANEAEGVLCIHHDTTRDERMAPYGRFPSVLAIGMAAENARIAAGCLGFAAHLAWSSRARPQATPLGGFAKVTCGERSGDAALRAAFREQLHVADLRTTNRRRTEKRAPLPDEASAALHAAADAFGARLRIFTSPGELLTFGRILGAVDRVRWVEESLHREIVRELRRNDHDARATGDGLELSSLELGASEAAGLAVLVHRQHLDALRETEGGQGLATSSVDDLVASDAFAVLEGEMGPEEAEESWFRGGQCVAQVWHAATALGLSLHPHAAPFHFRRAEDEQRNPSPATDLEPTAARWLEEPRRAFREIVPRRPGTIPLLAFRLTRAPQATARAYRRPEADVIRF